MSLPWLGCWSVDFEWLRREMTLVGSNLSKWHLKNSAALLGWEGSWQPRCKRSPKAGTCGQPPGARKQGPWLHLAWAFPSMPRATRSWRALCFCHSGISKVASACRAESMSAQCLCPLKSRCQSWLSKASLFVNKMTGQGAGSEFQWVALSRLANGRRVMQQPEKASSLRPN